MLNTKHATADPAAIYLVFTSNFPSGASYCAWHSDGTLSTSGVTIAFAYLPNLTDVRGCGVDDAGNGASAATQAFANVTTHEIVESVTDPQLNAWYDRRGAEISDKCAWHFAAPVAVGSQQWNLQEQWSNAAGRCVQQ